MSKSKTVTIYTDGACLGNPGPGGYAAVLMYQGKRKEIAGGFNKTTNNRMEILAAIKGLAVLKAPSKVTLYSDSKYLVDSIGKGWVANWKAKSWKRNKKDKARNVDLWKQLLELLDRHDVEFVWTRSHVGTRDNERCDFLATQAANQPNLPEDPASSGDPSQPELF